MKSPLRIARTLWGGLFPLYIMEELNFLPDSFQFVDVEEYDETLILLESGDIHANFNSLADAILLTAKGVDLKLIMASDLSIGMDGLVSKKELDHVQKLRGARVGVSLYTYAHVFLKQALAQFDISEEDLKLVNVRGENIPEWLAANKIDAGHTWGIYLDDVVKRGGNLLFTSNVYPGLLVDSLVVRREAFESELEQWFQFVKAHERALAYWQEDYERGVKIISRSTGLSVEKVQKLLEGVQFYTRESEKDLFDPKGTVPPNLYASGKIFMDFFLEKGILKKPLNLDRMFLNLTSSTQLNQKEP